MTIFRIITFFVLASICTSCAYQWGYQARELPNDYKIIYLPVFQNDSDLTGIEVVFTNALKYEFKLSRAATLKGPKASQAKLVGVVKSIETLSEAQFTADDDNNNLPQNTVLDTIYRLVAHVDLSLIDLNSGETVWTKKFNAEKVYDAPQLTKESVNSSNPLYNESAKRQFLSVLAKEMMREAHSQLSERF